MQPFLSVEEAAAGEELARKMMEQLTQFNPKACIAALAMCLTFAANATQVPLESIFQMQRNLLKALKEAEKNAPPVSPIVVPDEPKLILP